MKLWSAVLAGFFLVSPASAQYWGNGGSASSPAVSIMVNVSGAGPTVASNFVGLSMEVGDLVSGYYQGTTGNAGSFINVMKLLGSNGVLRMGAASADTTTMSSITGTIVSNFNSFANGIGAGWANVVWTLNGVQNSSTAAATLASSIATSFGPSNVTFQFGNEPISSTNFNASTYATMWNSYYTSVTGSVTGASYAALDDGFTVGQSTIIPTLTPGISGLAYISDHWYPFCRGVFSTANPSALLSSLASNKVSTFELGNSWAGSSQKQVLTETNSLCGHGQDGMSNRLMASAWVINLAITLLNSNLNGFTNYAGMYIHGLYTGSAPAPAFYNPVVQLGDLNFTAGTPFYGMMLVSNIEGQQLLPSAVGGSGNVQAVATLRTANKANILIVNNDVVNRVGVLPQQSAAWSTANVLQVKSATGAGCGDASVTIGGQAVGESGVWSGTTFSISSGQSIMLGPCEAALVSVQ